MISNGDSPRCAIISFFILCERETSFCKILSIYFSIATESTSLIEILYIIPYGALGFFFAKAFYETDNIFSSISVHMIHNTIAVLFAYLAMMG